MSNKRILIKNGKALIDETGKVLVSENTGGSATIKTQGSWAGTPVENGYVENVYLNTNLSIDEVINIIESANLTFNEEGMYLLYYTADETSVLALAYFSGLCMIANIMTEQFYFHNIDNEEVVSVSGFAKGWNPNITMPIAINGEVVSGGENDKISSLISTSQFEYTEGTPVELSGEYEETTITISEKGKYNLEDLIVNEKKIPFKIVGDFKDTIDFITDRMNFLTELVNDEIDIIQAYGCAGCDNLINVDLPNLSNAQNYAFADCYNLITVNLPNLSYADSFAFTHCGFEEINLPKLESVHTGAFQGCDDLKKIYLASVNYIGGHSFYMCSNLTDIYIGYDGVPNLSHSQWFDLAGTTQGYINVHVRSDYADQYASAPNWSSLITDGKIKIVGDYTD